MGKTSIEWCEHSINPFRYGRGHYCAKVSSGCANCYASAMQHRFGTPAFPGRGSASPVITDASLPIDQRGLWLDESKLHEVLSRRKPTRYFWWDMTDGFADFYPDAWLDRCFAVMALTPQHTHQVLTKRAERMLAWFQAKTPDPEPDCFGPWSRHSMVQMRAAKIWGDEANAFGREWPLPNVWLGVSVENQAAADERIPFLLQTPAAVRFLSCEPLLGPIEFSDVSRRSDAAAVLGNPAMAGIDWCIVGGESGPNARPMDLAWARSLVEQCRSANVACFVKQLGSKPRGECSWRGHDKQPPRWLDEDGTSTSVSGRPPHDLCHAIDDGWFPCGPELRDRKGGSPDEWPEDLRVREYPSPTPASPAGA